MSDEIRKPSYYAIIPANVRYDDSLPANAKLLYGELTALAGSDGYCWPSDAYLRKLYGVTRKTIQGWLSVLEENGYIERVTTQKNGTNKVDKRYIQIANLPSNKKVTCNKKVTPPSNKKVTPPCNKKVTGIITSSINTSINKNRAKPDAPTGPSLRDRFESLWKMYPKKKGKDKAYTAYQRAVKDGVTDEKIKQGITNYLAEIKALNTDPRFIKHGQTWFNQRGWDDDYDTQPSASSNRSVQGRVRESIPDWGQPGYQHESKPVDPSEVDKIKASLAAMRQAQNQEE